MPATLLTYAFDELPLISDRGRKGGFISGTATISAYAPHDWFIRAIHLNGILVDRDEHPHLWVMLVNALEGDEAEAISEAIRLEILEEAA